MIRTPNAPERIGVGVRRFCLFCCRPVAVCKTPVTSSFVALLQHFSPVFTAPTYQTFSLIVTGWLLSHRHRYITEVIFSCGRVGIGHWSRFHRFFSHAAWDLDTLSMSLAKLVATILAPGATLLWAV